MPRGSTSPPPRPSPPPRWPSRASAAGAAAVGRGPCLRDARSRRRAASSRTGRRARGTGGGRG
eukprot:18522-Pelagococcus_subviridis.AAC.24